METQLKIVDTKVSNGVLSSVGEVTHKLADRTRKIDFSKEILTEEDVTDLKLHLAYARSYADIVRLHMFVKQYEQTTTS